MSPKELEDWFPYLKEDGWKKTSEESEDYNCIAFAGGDEARKWDPDESGGRYWPAGVPLSMDLASFIKPYEVERGFVPSELNYDLEEGIEKIAIYCNYNPQLEALEVTHAARQLPSGKWTSKLGDLEDIEHNTLNALSGSWPAYGTVKQIIKRRRI